MATSSVAVLWIGVLSLVLTVLRYGVSGAPVSEGQVQFYNKLYQNSSQPRCNLPKVDVKSENYTRSKLNHLCDSKGVAKYDSLCIALTDLFPRLCQNQSTPRKVNGIVAVDLSNVNNLGVRKVCLKLQELRANISSLGHQKLVSPFVTGTPSNSAENDDSLCIELCKNSRDTREGFREDNKLEVNLPCILLLEGYTILQNISLKAEKQGISISNVGRLSAASLPGNQIGTSATKDTKLTKGNDSVAAKSKSEPTDAGTAAKKSVFSVNASPSPIVYEKKIPEAAAAAATTSTLKSKALSDVSLEQPGADPVQSSTSANKNEDEEKALTEKVQAIKNAVISGIPAVAPVDTSKRLNQTSPGKESKTSSSSTTSTTTTETIVDAARGNDIPMPLEKEKSSTATSRVVTDAPKKKDIDVVAPVPLNNDGSEKNEAMKNRKQLAKPLFSKKNDDSDVLAGLGEDDGADYNPGEDLDNGYGKPPTKFDGDKEVEMPQPETQNLGYQGDSSFKPAKSRFSGNAFREDIAFDRGTTINVSLKESEDTGFFNYFLFSVTLVGLVYLIVHNKKKLIAFVVEGKRPRASRSRRSSSSQYRRLENNFD